MKNLFIRSKSFIISAFIIGLILALNDISTFLIYKGGETSILQNLLSYTQVFFYDMGIAMVLLILLWLPYILLDNISGFLSKGLVVFVSIIVLVANLLLNKYYATTHLSLGSDLYGYSLEDIQMIVNTSTDFSIKSNLSFIIFPILFVLAYVVFKADKKRMEYTIIPLSIGLVFFVTTILIEIKAPTNLSYFAQESWSYSIGMSNKPTAWNEENKFPLLQKNSLENDVLGDNLNLKTEKPNIVIIVVEGLGSDFTGENAQYKGFTPYLDSLSKQSLYWSNFMSNTGRSFGVLPSILGSAPFGEKGFLEMDDIPDHLSLITLLKQNNYLTSYFEGGDSDFDHKINYLNNEGIDNILDQNNFGPGYVKAEGEKGFSWGYPDTEIFRKTLTMLDPKPQPRFDIIMTISNHEPFKFPNKEKYLEKAAKIRDNQNFEDSKIEIIDQHKEVFSSLVYTDDAIKNFMNAYKSNKNYDNTIFIITGDHRLIPVPQKDAIARYHVPLIIYSPMQKSPRNFKGISSHLDIMPSIMAMMKKHYGAQVNEQVPWIGEGLSDSESFKGNKNIPFMKYKGAFKDFISNNYYFSENTLYQIKDNLVLDQSSDDQRFEELKDLYNRHKRITTYVTQNNKILPSNMVINLTKVVKFSVEEKEKIADYTKGLNQTDIFYKARDMAHNKKYKDAHMLCDFMIKSNPNHFDARTLKGRMYGWNSEKEKAEKEFMIVIERNPGYTDAYSAILDLYWWNDEYKKANKIASIAAQNLPQNKDFQKLVKDAVGRFKNADKVSTNEKSVELLEEKELIAKNNTN